MTRQQKNMAAVAPPPERSLASLEEASTSDLVREAMHGARELVRLEVELAKEEVKDELKQIQRAAITFGIAAGASLVTLCLLAVALVLALGGTALVALLAAAGFLAVAGVAGIVGRGMLPKAPLEKTRNRLQDDMDQLKEHIV